MPLLWESFFVNDVDKWVYKRYSRADENSARIYFHTWSCMRKFDEEHEKIVAERRQAGNKRAWERRKGKTKEYLRRQKGQIMPIVDKQVYLAMLREKLDDYVSANTVRQIIADASETLSGFDVITLAPTSCEHNDSMQLIQAYLDALVIRGATPKTYDRYQYVLKRFYRDVDIPIRNVTKAHITNYIAAELKRGISKNTLKGQSGIYCRFFEWLWKEELIPKNPAANIDPMRAKAQPREALTAEEMRNANTIQELYDVVSSHL